MANTNSHLPPEVVDQINALVARTGSVNAAAKALGFPRMTLTDAMQRGARMHRGTRRLLDEALARVRTDGGEV